MTKGDRIVSQFSSIRAISTLAAVLTVCYGAIKFGSETWMTLLGGALTYLLKEYSDKNRSEPPKETAN